MNKEKLKEQLRALDEGILNGTINIPDNAIVSLPESTSIFTKKRLELIDVIRRKYPQSVQELATLTRRAKQAVTRDLKILERFQVVKLIKRGRERVPIIQREVIVLALPSNSVNPLTKAMMAEA